MLHRAIFFISCFTACLSSQESQGQQSPFEFVQRSDLQRELSIQPDQMQLIQELQPVCDAQCQSRIMEMLTSTSTELQTQFLALSPEGQQSVVQTLDNGIRENMESDLLDDFVLTPPQFQRFQQLRTQFMGIDSLLTDRVSGLMGFTPDQSSQLRELQNFGSELIGACGQNADLTQEQQQAGIQNIRNVIIDQSINILNDSQIQIFSGLCGEGCNFDEPASDNPDSNGDLVGDNLIETNVNPTQLPVLSSGSVTRNSLPTTSTDPALTTTSDVSNQNSSPKPTNNTGSDRKN